MSNRQIQIEDAIAHLDHRDAKQWTDDGDPTLDAVRKLTGFAITREEIQMVGVTRNLDAPKANVTPQTVEEAEQAVIVAAQALDIARARVRELQGMIGSARKRTADALVAWLAKFPVISQQTLARQEARRSQEQRRQMVEGGLEGSPQPRKANSYIDRINGRGGTADDFARRHLLTGYRRGAFGSHMQGRRLPPSER